MTEVKLRGIADPVRSREQACAELCPEICEVLSNILAIAVNRESAEPGCWLPFERAQFRRARALLSRMEGRTQ